MNDEETTDVATVAMHLLRDVSAVLARREEFLDTSGNGFNAFDSLRLSQEKFHSRMIGALLSPKSRHGLGALFLQRFFEMIDLNLSIPETKRGVSVTTEQYIGEIDEDTEHGGFIDILIESDRWTVAIENKIDESERNNQPKQLYRYWNWVKARGREFALVYLTPTGKTAPEGSTSGKDRKLEAGKGKDYICLSYTQIASWIGACIRDSVRFPRIREILVQYRDFLDQHVLPSRKEDKYMTEIEQLIQKGSFAAAEAIANALTNAKARAMESLLKAVLPSRIDSISTDEAEFSSELRRFAEGSATDKDPCKLFFLKQPRTNETMLLALAWDCESNRPGIGICCPNGGELGEKLLRRFSAEQRNMDATVWWPCWIWLDHIRSIRSDASFFDSEENQAQFRAELNVKFQNLCECSSEVAAEWASGERV